MSMIIAGGGAASVFAGEGQATVTFTASGTGRVTGASVETTITPVQNVANCNSGTTSIQLALPEQVTGGDFLAIAVSETGGAQVVSINDVVEGYDADVAALNPVAWWKYNEQSGTVAYDSGTGANNGIASGAFIVGVPGPISGTPADTAWEFFQGGGGSVSSEGGLLGAGLLGAGLLGDGGGTTEAGGQVQISPATDIQFGTTSFSIAGWINGTAATGETAYIFNNGSPVAPGASVSTPPNALGWGIRGLGIMGGSGGGTPIEGSAGFALQMNEGTDRLEFQIGDNAGNVIAVQTPISYGNSGWHFVVGVVNRASELLSLYVDGALVGSDSVAGVGSVTNAATVPTMADGLEGDLSQVFIVDYALTAEQIAQVYFDSNIVPSSNRWIQAAYSYNNGYGTEIWYARGVKPGITVVTVDLTSNAASTACCGNLSEWSGVWYVDPLDQWAQNYGTSATTAVAAAVQPRAGSDLFLAVMTSSAGFSATASGYVPLAIGNIGYGSAAYYVSPYDVAETTSWPINEGTFVTCHASFVAGDAGYNPDFQFPETLVEISTTTNYLAPLQGYGVWTNISRYVEAMSLGPLGRQHELARIDSTTADFTVNGRDGSFNVWNTESFLYGGLLPMNPVKVSTATFNGETQNNFYGYIQAVTPKISDVLNVDATISCNDILALLNLKYLSNNSYEQLLLSGG